MLGVPLQSGDELLGVLHVGRLVENAFTEDDVKLLQIAADRVATALQARQVAIATAAARLLERGLQPTRLPRVAGLDLAARYVPAEGRAVGGDWYDSFLLPSGALWLVVGDVGGHGLDAAVVMGRVKSALRSYALLDLGPSRALEMTDRKVQHFEFGVIVTVICAVAMPPYDRFEISSAGHLPPVIAGRVGAAELVTLKVGPPLGAVAGARYHASGVHLAPESVLLLYTDGLIERRDEDLDIGLERLCAAVGAEHPERVCQTVMRQLIGNRRADDDIALLAARVTAQ
jgi:serine phosphatase RsbU (regulator of sigma subunit)